MSHLPFQPAHYYHIYNRANGKDNLFRQAVDYRYFLLLYAKYINEKYNRHSSLFQRPFRHKPGWKWPMMPKKPLTTHC